LADQYPFILHHPVMEKQTDDGIAVGVPRKGKLSKKVEEWESSDISCNKRV